jgi:hypothetical protein
MRGLGGQVGGQHPECFPTARQHDICALMTSKCHISFHFQTQATIKLPAMITVNRRSLLRNAADPSAGLVIASRVRAVADGHGVEQRRALDEVAPDEEAPYANMLYSAWVTGERTEEGAEEPVPCLAWAPPCCPAGPGDGGTGSPSAGVWGARSPPCGGSGGALPPETTELA